MDQEEGLHLSSQERTEFNSIQSDSPALFIKSSTIRKIYIKKKMHSYAFLETPVVQDKKSWIAVEPVFCTRGLEETKGEVQLNKN